MGEMGGWQEEEETQASYTETLPQAQPCWRPSLFYHSTEKTQVCHQAGGPTLNQNATFADSLEAISDRQDGVRTVLPLARLNLQQTINTKQPAKPTSQAARGGCSSVGRVLT